MFSSGEGEEDFCKSGVENVGGELLQVAVEGVGDKEVKDWSGQQGEGGAKGQANKVGRLSGHTLKCWSWARAP